MSRFHRLRSEDGALTAAYGAVLLVVAALVTALLGLALAPRLREAGETALCQLFGDGWCTTSEPVSYQPPPCEVSSRRERLRAAATVGIVHLGGELAFLRSEFADGRTTLTFVDLAELGATVGVGGGGGDAGPPGGSGLEVSADLTAAIELASGSTWTFDDPTRADAMEGWLRREVGEDRRGKGSRLYRLVNGTVEWLTGETPPPPPDITVTHTGLRLAGHLAVDVGAVQAGAGLEAAVRLGRETDHRREETTDLYEVAYGADARASLFGADTGASLDGSGTVAVTRDRRGRVTALELVHRRSRGVDDDLAVGAGPDEHTTLTTTRLEIRTAAQAATAERWLRSLGDVATATVGGGPRLDGRPDAGPAPLRDLSALLADHATVSRVVYEGDTTGLSVAAEAAFGLTLGLSIEHQDTTARAIEASYLGPPVDGVRAFHPDLACVGTGA